VSEQEQEEGTEDTPEEGEESNDVDAPKKEERDPLSDY